MHQVLKGIFRFLPVQLLFLHFRKYQLLLIFWVIVLATITGNFASHFGAVALFLAPEYLGEINFVSMFLLGGAMAVFVMAWHITTFIIHSQRMPFMGALRQAFLKYCINNSLLPLTFLVFYSIVCTHYQLTNEHASAEKIIRLQLGFYLGFLLIILISFAYFFRVDRDLLKVVLSRITNPSRIREIIPYDTLDYEFDIIRADTYISGLHIEHISKLESYAPRLLATVLRRHHRNAITATIFAFATLILLGVFMEEPLLRIPAGAGFLIFFAVLMGIVGAMKYFLKSWELLGWISIAVLLSWMVHAHFFDLRSVAYGLNYHAEKEKRPEYSYSFLHSVFCKQKYLADKKDGEQRLVNWKKKRMETDHEAKPPLIVLCISGGGSRAAYWTFRSLQYADSVTKGKIFRHTVLISGASGGMFGAAYWRTIQDAYQQGKVANPYEQKYQENIGKDLLNAVIFSFVSVDLISPFNKVSIGGYSYTKDRGYALEQELINNTEGMLDQKLGDYRQAEADGSIPALIVNGTIVNDGRKLMMSAQPVAYLTQPESALQDTTQPAIDAVDFATFFSNQNPYNLRLTTALRMNATFPFILPVVKLPSDPQMNIMDAGLRDNFGVDVVSRYLYVYREWMKENVGNVIFLQIRDTRESNVLGPSDQNSLAKMIMDPLFVIQNKWESFQSYSQSYLKDYAPDFMNHRLHFITLQYIPQETNNAAALNFHLTQKEKKDLYQSINNPLNQAQIDTLVHLLQ
ncbi:hypothetical protein ACTHGU_15200 [Chitinophagaceae bacterium MMS25-I14]